MPRTKQRKRKLSLSVRAGKVWQIHVDQGIIKLNKAENRNDPSIVIRKDGVFYTLCGEVEWNGPSKLVSRPDNPLPGGTVVYIETPADLTILK